MVVIATGSGGGHKVLLISGKQAASSAGTQGGFSRSISMVLPSSGTQASSDSDSNGSGQPQRKRQRLTHLSPEEKALRRKLKNRVAAQTARDRKKAKMGELEQQVLELELENQKLHIENRLLREKTHGLVTENEELRQRLGLDTLEIKEKVQVLQSSVGEVGLVIGSSERSTQATCASAAGAGPAVIKSEDAHMATDSPDSTDSESDLLLGILDILDPELFLKNCAESEFRELPQLGEEEPDPVPSPTPAPLGTPSVKLEALNELIHFDHIYTKPLAEVTNVEQNEESIPEVKIEEPALAAEEIVEVEPVSVKEEPEEIELIPEIRVNDFLTSVSPTCSPEKSSCVLDAYSDSGYEQSPSPFSNMSSPLCADSPWDDVFANELFPQLISV
ncbi:LOW QUALITY PROTEIN: X-box-binding protein 1 [Lepisosteus oculatus]|uniref:LOW QUALITY PROTEIN: X-box-binding protein 1 n=1 Tax=Lepisosteus oculatus TaxID=7918 RepID=UPI0007403579|nr:PREDICTED: LOW QUALITY PROTEIN: X-box-binding protein 1 [Lepisosteus oculatus]